jgi:hypothetical protein
MSELLKEASEGRTKKDLTRNGQKMFTPPLGRAELCRAEWSDGAMRREKDSLRCIAQVYSP